MTCNGFIRALNAERAKDSKILKKYSGIRHLLTELYPDNAHFIYELLQNAEDAQATEITFSLTSEKLVVKHNATRLFTEQDIKSITSIGDSTKRDDINKIGKFGVGFKAVFSYTDTPIIYSGDYAFKICDLIVPELIAPHSEQTGATIFEFPFNNQKKPKEQAFEEIAKGLRDLSETTLLFLTNIKAINWSNENEPFSYTRLRTQSEYRVEIESCLAGEEISTAHYLRFMSQIPGKPEHLQVGLAYSLHAEKENYTFNKKTKGLVSIFFPAEKETSNFRFHIHAPFSATVARDSIKDIDENVALITAISELAVNSLHNIKAMGLLTRAFLDVLPNSQDNIPEFYDSISKKIWEALRTQPLIPTYTDNFETGEHLYHATDDKDDKLKNLLDSADLARLEDRNNEKLDWCLDVPEALRAKIGIKAIKSKQFIEKLVNPLFTLSNWLELKENVWMQQFYSYLYSYVHEYSYQLKQTSLVRLIDGSHVLAKDAYFSSGDIINDNDFPKVCAATYKSGNEEQQEEREHAYGFLKNIGVTEVTERDKIELIINKWEDKKPSDEEYVLHLKQFIDFYKKNGENVFLGESIFWGDSKDGTTSWYPAKKLFIDSPLRETGITAWFEEEPNYYLLSKKYANLPSLNVDDLVDFAKRLGAKVSTDFTWEDIESILRQWKISPPNDNEYLKYFPLFLSAHWPDRFKDQAIFWGDTTDGETKLVKASEIFIDSPFQDTSISTWYSGKYYYLLSKKYTEHPSPDFSSLINFAKKLGAKDRLPIIEIRASPQKDLENYFHEIIIAETKEKIDKDWCISKYEWDCSAFEHWLKSPSEAKAHAIWMTMNHPDTKAEVLTAWYKRLQRPLDKAKKRCSKLVYTLRLTAWIPQTNETGTSFVTPAKARQNRLPEKFKYNDSNGWLTAIEFGKDERELAAERQREIDQKNNKYQEKVKIAKSYDLDSPEEMAAAVAFYKKWKSLGKNISELTDLVTNNAQELPDRYSNNPERRAVKAKNNAHSLPEKKQSIRSRTVTDYYGSSQQEARQYLEAQYQDGHILICQICQQEQPVKVNGEYVFIAADCIPGLDKFYTANNLCLCPNHWKMYDEAKLSRKDIITSIVSLDAQVEKEFRKINFDLGGNQVSVYFTQNHLTDLQAVIKSLQNN